MIPNHRVNKLQTLSDVLFTRRASLSDTSSVRHIPQQRDRRLSLQPARRTGNHSQSRLQDGSMMRCRLFPFDRTILTQ